MKTLKKALSVILGLAIMLSCVAGMQVSVAAEGTLALSVQNATVADGTVTVPVSVDTNSGFRALGIEVSYDANVLKLIKAEKTAFVADVNEVGACSETFDVNPYVMQWAYVTDENVAATGTIAYLTFNVLDASAETAKVSVNVTEAWDAAKGAVEATGDEVNVVFKKECTSHVAGEWVMTTAPDPTNDAGVQTQYCTVCGAEVATRTVKAPRFQNRTLNLEDKVIVSFYCRQSDTADNGYTDYKVVFEFAGQEYVVEDYYAKGTAYYFDFTNVAPHQFGETITATIYGRVGTDETWYQGRTATYSVLTYCSTSLSKLTSKTEMGTLMVDILNYGAAAQAYAATVPSLKYSYDSLVTDGLTDTQKSWASPKNDSSSYVNIRTTHTIASTPAAPTAAWKNGGLYLENAINYDLRFGNATGAETIKSLEGYGVRVSMQNTDGTFEVIDEIFYDETPEAFSAHTNAGQYIYRCSSLNPSQIRETVYFEILKDGEVVSKAMTYNAESYAAASYASAASSAELLALLDAMMCYADGAYAYVN